MSRFYDDGRFVVTSRVLATPSRIYPIAQATVRRRNDLLLAGVLSLVIGAFAIRAYGDLLTRLELGFLLSAPIVLFLVAAHVGILAVDSVGHRRIIVFTTRGRAKKIFRALRDAKVAEISHLSIESNGLEDSGN